MGIEAKPTPLRNVVLGGTPTEREASCGLVRYLTPDEVRAVSMELERPIEVDLRRRYDPEAFRAADIYPNGQSWGMQPRTQALDTFERVGEFFATASRQGDVVLLSSD